MEEFSIDGKEYIELNRVIKYISWVESGGAANATIADGQVKVNGVKEFRKRNKLRVGDVIKFNGKSCKIIE
ncbi:MAG: ribosome-associated protein [Saprospiraceae bacterium]|jgi:ribosome-associated protein